MKQGALLSRIASAVILALLPGFDISGQIAPEPRTLSGTVYYAGGNQPAEHATVDLRTTEGNSVAQQTTSSTGWFEFRGLVRGSYVLVISLAGFETVNLNVDLTLNSRRGNSIYLTPRPDSSPTATRDKFISAHELSMPQRARNSMETGKRKLYKEKNAQGSLRDFEEALRIAPDYYEAHYQIAMAYLTFGNREPAEKSLKKAVALSRDSYGEADVALGTLMLDKRDFSAGEKTIRRGIELNPNFWLGHYELGRALLNQNRIQEAESAALQARSLAPSVPLVYRLLSNVHMQEKKYVALLADIDAYLKLDADSPAGIRAKQLREEVRQKIASGKQKP
jgi:Tfp pilus assembly protein PilF